MDKVIDIKHLNKSFGTHEVLKDINFSVNKGEVVCIIGSSGSGKSTLLRCVNLLEKPSGGQIIYNGINILSGKQNIHEYRTKLGMVFQQFILLMMFNLNLSSLKQTMALRLKLRKVIRLVAETNLLKVLFLQKNYLTAHQLVR